MLLEQNLFWVYRLLLKTPRVLYFIALAFLIFVAFSQITYISRANKTIDFSKLLLDYVVQKHEQRQAQANDADSNETIVPEMNKTARQEDISKEYAFLDDGTFLDFRLGKDEEGSVALNYTTNHTASSLPVMFAVRNQELAYMSPKPAEYLAQHKMSFDAIYLPPIPLKEPTFAYYFQTDLQTNEIVMTSFRASYVQFQHLFRSYLLEQNITDNYQEIEQMFLHFYFVRDNSIRIYTVNFFNYLGLESLPSFVVKSVYTMELLIVLLAASVFMGLLVRYAFITVYTVFLVSCDRCLGERGWARQFLNLLCLRYRSGRAGTLKMMVFYMGASVGVAVMLAFGAYCILIKLVQPALPLLIDEYGGFFLDTLLVIEVFHYVMSRSRTATRFFPILSFALSFATLFLCSLKHIPCVLMLLNLNITLHLIIFLVFALLEKAIIENDGLDGGFTPSPSRPRMLFYAGFDISWEKSLPPLWTYFTSWFDYSHFTQAERCFIEKDYQLLYGRMLGLNQRQEIPEDDYELEEMPSEPNEPSNEAHLIPE